MTLEEVSALLTEIHATYGGKPPTPQQAQSWHAALHDVAPEAAYERLTAWMREHCYRPTPADLRGVPRVSTYAEPAAPLLTSPACIEPGCHIPRLPNVHLCEGHYRALMARQQEPQA